MAGNMSALIEAAQDEFRSNDAELAFQRERQFLQIIRRPRLHPRGDFLGEEFD